jgi:1,4-dihydroxy-6-naphthoate synthase
MILELGFSPCPNDTFIFDALVNGRVDTGDLRFEPLLEDVQTLNRWALEGRLDVTKISYGVLPLVAKDYLLLDSGGAMGRGVGPLLVARPDRAGLRLEAAAVAIPGEHTTAHLLFSLAHPEVARKRFMPFSEIEEAVLSGAVDAGVIIHEGRFTYQAKGLVKLVDLGSHWEAVTGSPIPLGGIVARRTLGAQVAREVDRLIRASVEQALGAYPRITDYVKRHAQEMDEAVMRQHVDLYVNDFSVGMGEGGRSAVRKLLEVYARTWPGGEPVPAQVFIG